MFEQKEFSKVLIQSAFLKEGEIKGISFSKKKKIAHNLNSESCVYILWTWCSAYLTFISISLNVAAVILKLKTGSVSGEHIHRVFTECSVAFADFYAKMNDDVHLNQNKQSKHKSR